MKQWDVDLNNVRLQYRGYEISLAQHLKGNRTICEEIAVCVNGSTEEWEIVYYPAPNDADDYIVGIQAAKKFIDTLHQCSRMSTKEGKEKVI